MEFKGTQGRWIVGKANMKDTNKDELVVSKEGGDKESKGYRLVCCISPFDKYDNIDLSNALLISKAPEMLEVINDLKKYFKMEADEIPDDVHMKTHYFHKLNKLIKEATEL